MRLGSSFNSYERWLAEHPEASEGPAFEAGALGETEYSIRAIPLGGFVKMLGEGEGSESGPVKSADPRAYPNKSVGVRMAIISAGVIMNLLWGILFFVWAFGQGGLLVIPARIGGVLAGHPAYAAGLRMGDEIVAVDGRRNIDFFTLKRITAMSGPGQALHLELKRPGIKEIVPVNIEPRRLGAAEMKTMGILPPSDLTFGPKPVRPSADLPDPGTWAKVFQKGDQVVAAGPEGQKPELITDQFELETLLALSGPALAPGGPPRGGARSGAEQVEATLPVTPFVDFGFVLTTGPVVAIRPDGPAARAGFRVKDRIVAVEGVETLDPMHLPDVFAQRAGKPVVVQVARSEGGKPEETLRLTVTPQPDTPWLEWVADRPLGIPGLGLAFEVQPTITAVRSDTPAARAGSSRATCSPAWR